MDEFTVTQARTTMLEQYYTGVNERENWSGQARSKIETKAATTQGEGVDAGSDHKCGVRFTAPPFPLIQTISLIT